MEANESVNEPHSIAADILDTLRNSSQQNAETAAATANLCPRAGRGTIEDFEKKLEAQNDLIIEAIDTMKAKVKKEEAGVNAEEAGLSAAEKRC